MISFTLALMWMWLFIWLRLFEKTAFFIGLVESTLTGVMSFTLIFFLVITAFSSITFILNERRQIDEGTRIFNEDVDNDVINAFLSMYQIAMGNYYTGLFRGTNQEYLWVIFIAATFLI